MAARPTVPVAELQGGGLLLTDSGLETTLVFADGADLPCFAAFVLLRDQAGRERLERYYREHAAVAVEAGLGLVLETPNWRANPDWAPRLGLSTTDLVDADRAAVAMLDDLRRHLPGDRPVLVSGCLGPRGDGYDGTAAMTADQARAYHAPQVTAYEEAGADLVHAMTITYPAEAVGIVRAAAAVGVPAAVSFTVETDGRLPDGTPLREAVERTDAETDGYAVWFGVNCAHPDHIVPALTDAGPWTSRLGVLRANASRRSHAELDEAPELDAGDPDDLARGYLRLRELCPGLTVLGGCCGTDVRHVRAIAAAVTLSGAPAASG